MIRRPPRSTLSSSSAASDVYKRQLLDKEGYLKADKVEESDIIIINTCAVREKAKNRLYGHIGILKSLKISKPGLMICVGGCSAQNLKDEILQVFPYVDIIFGTHNISGLPDLIFKKSRINKSICDIKKYEFAELLDNVAQINGLKRIRFMTSHPKDLSGELIDVISKNKNIMNHIH